VGLEGLIMNILMVGSGKGSFAMRAVQLGAALGARVTSAPSAEDWAWASVVVLVKRAGTEWAERARKAGVPIVWDALDFWRQPADNGASEGTARAMLDNALKVIRPALMIGATEAMAASAGGVCLPHHGYLGLHPTPIRREVQSVGYDGNALYLDRWARILEHECAKRGWAFIVNPPALTDVDLVVALRGGPWDGWICRNWKSGVKIANAILAGRPVLSEDSAAFSELRPVGAVVTDVDALSAALDRWADYGLRETAYQAGLERAHEFQVDILAQRYRGLLTRALTTESASC